MTSTSGDPQAGSGVPPAPENSATSAVIVVPPEIMEVAVESLGRFFERISGVDRRVLASDLLNPSTPIERAQRLQRYTTLDGKRLLEIGSGFGTNLAVWMKQFHLDAWGIEPGGIGFSSSFQASRRLLEANGLDPSRILDATGENLPFDEASFDIVYSANVLEHTQDPAQVLSEAARVLRPGGVLHFEIPNFLSYYEGHYAVLQPPVLWKPMLPLWVRFVFRRDPAFARTLQTCINPWWCRKAVRRLNRQYPVELLSLGADLFLERLSRPFEFQTEHAAGKLARLIALVQRLNYGNWMGRLIVAMQGFYPIYLTLRRVAVVREQTRE